MMRYSSLPHLCQLILQIPYTSTYLSYSGSGVGTTFKLSWIRHDGFHGASRILV